MLLNWASIGLEVRLCLQRLYRSRNVRNLQTDMMSGAPMRCIRLLFGEHKFNVIVSVRDLEINPGEHCAGGTTTPCLLEAQYLRIEFVLGVDVGDDQPDMRHMLRD